MRSILTIALALAAGAAAAQADSRRDSSDARVPGAPVEYRSAFTDYRPYREPELGSWRQVNDEVRGLGGHKGHATPEKNGAEKGAEKPKAGHAGHGTHK